MQEVIQFKSDLSQMSNKEILIKYVFSNRNWYLEKHLGLSSASEVLEALDTFQAIVSDSFDISFKSSVMVGSAKTGFSMAPYKIFKQFDDESSDIDIAIISAKHFEECWEKGRTHMKTRHSHLYPKITSSVFNGFISTPFISEVEQVRQPFNRYTDKARREIYRKFMVGHEINFRVYRSWKDLQDYHLKGIRKAKQHGV